MKNQKKQKFSLWFLKQFYLFNLQEGYSGDVEEEFLFIRENEGKIKACFWIWTQVFKSFPIFLKSYFYWSAIMFKNYFTLAYRSLFKNKLLGVISIFSLSVAIGGAVAIFVVMDLTYNLNKCHKNAKQIFQVENIIDRDGTKENWGTSPVPLGPSLKIDFPQVQRFVRIENSSGIMKYNDKVFNESFRFVDSGFLEMFTFPLESGEKTGLKNKNAMVLSEEMAIKYFGDEFPIGKEVTIRFNNGNVVSFLIQGVAEKLPINAGFTFNILIPYENRIDAGLKDLNNWQEKTLATFIQLNNPDEINTIQNQMDKYLSIQNESDPDWKTEQFIFDPLLDIAKNQHKVRKSISVGLRPVENILFNLLGLFLVLLACFNYVNIAISSASRRLKEIGIRKVLGSNKLGIIQQFLGENILLCLIALIIGAGLTQTVFLPAFYKYTGIPPLGNVFTNMHLWIFLPLLLVFVGLSAGVYPAFYISAFQPATIFRGKQKLSGKKLFTRVLITFQFVVTFLLLILTIVVGQNAKYQRSLDWGYNQNQIVVVPLNSTEQFNQIKNEIRENPKILDIAGARQHIGRSLATEIVEFQGKKHEVKKFEIGKKYTETMQIRLNQGRLFNPDLSTDFSQSVIINQQFAEKLEWQNPIGQYIRVQNKDHLVIGVVENFHYDDFTAPIEPTIFSLTDEKYFNFLLTKMKAGTVVQTADYLSKTWKTLFPDDPYNAFYQDQLFASFFRGEENITKLFSLFAVVALIISCMGLFGLASVNINKRIKEISVRKVLGAKTLGLMNLINRQFLVLLIISSFIATPLGYLMVKAIMGSVHHYHIPISISQFVFTFVIILLTAVLTISSLLYRAANINPVETLKYE